MRIKPLRSMVGSYGKLKRNRPAVLDDRIAEALIRRGVAVPYLDVEEAAGMASENPPQGPDGGPTGKVKRSSSSPEGQAPASSRSRSSKAKRASSPSTKDGA